MAIRTRGVSVSALHIAIVGAIAGALASPVHAAPRALRVAVYDLELTDGPERLGRVMTDAVVEEVRKLEAVAVVGMSEIKAMLDHEAEKQLAGCSQDSCVSEIAEALGVDALVIGSIATVGTDRVFLLKRIDQQAASTAASFTVRVAADDEDSLLASIGDAIKTVFPDRALRPGFARGVSERTAKRLHPPPLPPLVFYSGLAFSGAAFLAAAVVTAPAALTVGAFEAYKSDPENRDRYDLKQHAALGSTAQGWLTGAAATWTAAATLGALTLLAWPFTNFESEDVGAVTEPGATGEVAR